MKKSKLWSLCCYSKKNSKMAKMEKTVKATLLIQKWFRRYMARLELRRRYTWNIFQSLEYAGEHDQVKLYNFFNALMTHIPTNNTEEATTSVTNTSTIDEYFTILIQDDSDDDEMSGSDNEFRISFPLTENIVRSLIETYKTKRHFRLPARDVGEILKRSIICLRKLPNLNRACTALAKQITVCGDLHGKFDDLLSIFHKNGFPSHENPYVFNGDFVDRGRRGIEVFIALLCLFLLYPEAIFLNRGNHEDSVMNSRYGFIREVQQKYPRTSSHILKLIEGVYRWLPLGTLVNNKILVVHGGIADTTDLTIVETIDRGKYVSLLRPPLSGRGTRGSDSVDKSEWKQVFDLLWSDPMTGNGCVPNTLRGAGTYFGPNVTRTFLKKHDLSFLVRSHECKLNGYELCHDDKVITIFSASNYYEIGSNTGAYLNLLGDDLTQHFVQFSSIVGKGRNLNCFQRMSIIESSVVREIQGQIMKHKSKLEEEFLNLDPDNTGFISIGDWCKVMESSTNLELPWRMLREKLVNIDPTTQQVDHKSTFDNIGKTSSNSVQGVEGYSTVVETLYKNRQNLEAIFRIIDKDNSGYINREEFHEACELIKEYLPTSNSMEQLDDICRLMDLNKDGLVDLNEFLESFRMVDKDRSRTEEESAIKDSVPEVKITISVNNKPNKNVDLKTSKESPESGSPNSLPLFTVSPMSSASAVDIIPSNELDKSDSCIKAKNINVAKELTSYNRSDSIRSLNCIEIIDRKDAENYSILKSNSDELVDAKLNEIVRSPVLSTRRGSQI